MAEVKAIRMSERYNPLLKRLEVSYVFKNANGKISRNDAKELISKELNRPKDNIYVIKLEGEYGTNDLRGLFYIYDDPNLAARHLKKYLHLRALSKEERKKAYDERRKKKAEAK